VDSIDKVARFLGQMTQDEFLVDEQRSPRSSGRSKSSARPAVATDTLAARFGTNNRSLQRSARIPHTRLNSRSLAFGGHDAP
jgi:hypothetical protein